MAHNPSYVGRTHVVTVSNISKHGDSAPEILGVHANYGSARHQIDEHVNYMNDGKQVKARRHTGGAVHYTHPDDEPYSLDAPTYHIHREKPGGGFEHI